MYRVSIKSFPDYKHLLHENYVEYKHIFYHYLRHFLNLYVMCLFLSHSCIITNLKARIADAFATTTEDMLGNTWREIDYRLDVLRATKGAHFEVHKCIVKKTS